MYTVCWHISSSLQECLIHNIKSLRLQLMKIRLETRSQFYKIYTSLADQELDKIEQT